MAWQAGWWPASCSGVIELAGALVAERIRRSTPRAALLSTLAGIALGFIAIGFLFRTFARPIVGLATLAIMLLTYFGRVAFHGGLPGGLVAVALGTVLAWLTGLAPVGAAPAGRRASTCRCRWSATSSRRSAAGICWPLPLGDLPMGLFNVSARSRTSSPPKPRATRTRRGRRWR